jgi:hypothetical protein
MTDDPHADPAFAARSAQVVKEAKQAGGELFEPGMDAIKRAGGLSNDLINRIVPLPNAGQLVADMGREQLLLEAQQYSSPDKATRDLADAADRILSLARRKEREDFKRSRGR